MLCHVSFPWKILAGEIGVRFMRLSLIERSMKSMNSPHLGLPGPSCCDQVFDAVQWVLHWNGKHVSKSFSRCLSNCTTPREISGLNVIARHYEGPSEQDGHFSVGSFSESILHSTGQDVFGASGWPKQYMELVHLPTSTNSLQASKYSIDVFFLKKSTSSHSEWFPLSSLHQTRLGNKNLSLWLSGWSWHATGKHHRWPRERNLTGLQETAIDIFRTKTCGIFLNVFSSHEILVGKPDTSLYPSDFFRWNLGLQDRLAFHADNFVVDERVSLWLQVSEVCFTKKMSEVIFTGRTNAQNQMTWRTLCREKEENYVHLVHFVHDDIDDRQGRSFEVAESCSFFHLRNLRSYGISISCSFIWGLDVSFDRTEATLFTKVAD